MLDYMQAPNAPMNRASFEQEKPYSSAVLVIARSNMIAALFFIATAVITQLVVNHAAQYDHSILWYIGIYIVLFGVLIISYCGVVGVRSSSKCALWLFMSLLFLEMCVLAIVCALVGNGKLVDFDLICQRECVAPSGKDCDFDECGKLGRIWVDIAGVLAVAFFLFLLTVVFRFKKTLDDEPLLERRF
eukprot:TRINITY_DN984_c0_g1_i1.p1 TRINITY_DN984_c0_g1~~TRINITY_DN984_c0_g1_i1.p1  ORF type:complete len:188 (+),score=37.12 TRINITY_DN984_c0_g1_i1:100-663(+)